VSVSLVKAATDPRLFAATLTPWPKQLELLASFDGPERLHVIAAGRQSAKSTTTAMLAVHNCCFRDDLDGMVPRGRVRYVLVAAPSESQAREFVSLCAALIDASPALAKLAKVSADRIDFTLTSGARTAIRAMAANSRSVRGMSASLIVLDEFAHFADTAGPASDERMFAALEPSTRAFGDKAKVVIISTPFGETGKFHELFQAAASGLLPSARALCAPTWEMVPGLDQAWRDARLAELGADVFAQEIAAEFVGSGGSFFDLRGVEFDDSPAAPEDGRNWVAGLDPAFHNDRFGVVVVGEAVSDGVLIVGRVEAISPGGRLRSLDLRRGREDRTLAAVAEIIEPYRPRIVTDQHAADSVSSFFGRLGVQVAVRNLTGPVQTAAFVSTRTRLLDGSLRLWRAERLVEDLRRVRARDTETIHLPHYAGGHCDAVSALCLAVYELRRVGGVSQGRARGGGTPITAGLLDGEIGSRPPRRRGDPDSESQNTRRTPPRSWPGQSSNWKNRQF
jgi:hypothetical protein